MEYNAWDVLRDHQRQLDEHGSEVGVSRQALNETLDELDRLHAPPVVLERVSIDKVEYVPSLGPGYSVGQRFAAKLMAQFQTQHFKPMVDKLAEDFRDKLWSDMVDSLLDDTELNVGNAIWRLTEETVTALLTGEEWAMERYPFADFSRGQKVREAVAMHGGDALLMKRIADLEAEVAKRDQTIKTMRDYR